MMPNTSVSPAAIRNSITPSCRPFRHCSATRSAVNAGPRRRSLHLTFLIVGVLVILEDRLLDLHLDLAATALHGLQQVEVLDREVVRVVGELAARGPKVGLANGGDHAPL